MPLLYKINLAAKYVMSPNILEFSYFAARFILSSKGNNCCLLYFNANFMSSFTKKSSASGGIRPQTPYRGSIPGLHWGTSVPQAPSILLCPPNNPVRSTPLDTMTYTQERDTTSHRGVTRQKHDGVEPLHSVRLRAAGPLVNVPWGQGWHCVAPSTCWYVSAGQSTHSVPVLYVPGGHASTTINRLLFLFTPTLTGADLAPPVCGEVGVGVSEVSEGAGHQKNCIGDT